MRRPLGGHALDRDTSSVPRSQSAAASSAPASPRQLARVAREHAAADADASRRPRAAAAAGRPAPPRAARRSALAGGGAPLRHLDDGELLERGGAHRQRQRQREPDLGPEALREREVDAGARERALQGARRVEVRQVARRATAPEPQQPVGRWRRSRDDLHLDAVAAHAAGGAATAPTILGRGAPRRPVARSSARNASSTPGRRRRATASSPTSAMAGSPSVDVAGLGRGAPRLRGRSARSSRRSAPRRARRARRARPSRARRAPASPRRARRRRRGRRP